MTAKQTAKSSSKTKKVSASTNNQGARRTKVTKTVEIRPAKKAVTTTANNKKTSSLKTTTQKTSVVKVKYDTGFNNQLYIRGEGAGLSWEKGLAMTNSGSTDWMWETKDKFSNCSFKVLINDETFENGENHNLQYGSNTQVIPNFS